MSNRERNERFVFMCVERGVPTEEIGAVLGLSVEDVLRLFPLQLQLGQLQRGLCARHPAALAQWMAMRERPHDGFVGFA